MQIKEACITGRCTVAWQKLRQAEEQQSAEG